MVSRLVNSPSHISNIYPQLAVESESSGLATRENSELEEISERAKDDGSVRITLELARPIRTNMGAYIPNRESPSPCFMALLPLLSRVKKIKFVVWGAYDWWKGPQQLYVRAEKSERPLVKRTSSDQTDEVLSTRKNACSVTPVPASSKPNPLSIAIDVIMKHLPLVEEVKVDVLIYAGDYWNWDLPDNRWEGIQGWLDGTIYSHEGKKLKKVYKRLIACEPTPPARGVTFYHQLETCEDMKEDSTSSVVHIAEGTGEVCALRHFLITKANIDIVRYLRILKIPRKNPLSPRPTIALNDCYQPHHSPCGPYHEERCSLVHTFNETSHVLTVLSIQEQISPSTIFQRWYPPSSRLILTN